MANKFFSSILIFLKIILILFLIAGGAFLTISFYGKYKPKNKVTTSNNTQKFYTNMCYFDSFMQCLLPFNDVLNNLNGKTADDLKECLRNLNQGCLNPQNHPIYARIIRRSQNKGFIINRQNDIIELYDLIMDRLLEECDLKKLESNISWSPFDENNKSSFISNIQLTPADHICRDAIVNFFQFKGIEKIRVPGPNIGIFSFQLNQSGSKVASKDFKEKIRRLERFKISCGTYELESFAVHSGSSSSCGHYVAYRKQSGNWYNINNNAIKLDNNFDLICNLPSILFFRRIGE